MKPRALVPVLLMLLAVLACSPSLTAPPQGPAQTALARTQAAVTSQAAQALTQAAPSPTLLTIKTPSVTDTPNPTDTSAPTDTVEAPEVASATASPLPSATPSPTPTRRPVVAGPSFLDTVVAVKKQVDNVGWQIDLATNSGTLDCQEVVNSYEYVAPRTTLNNVPASLAGAYGLYSQGVNLFLTKSADLYTNCKNYLANPSGGGSIPALQWTVTRTAVNDADQLLRQAIIAAGGTP